MAGKPYVIGITGTIGSGKSTVGRILSELNVPVIDTDLLVHELLSSETPVQRSVIERFGDGILDYTNTVSGRPSIDRKTLGAMVFGDDKARKDLEALVHPAVIMECRKRVTSYSQQKLVAVLVPLLFETGLKSEYDEVWTIYADDNVLRERLQRRDKLDEDGVNKRLAAQWSQEKKMAMSEHVIDNSKTPQDTRSQVQMLVNRLQTSIS